MAYKKASSQRGVPPHLVKWKFDTYVGDKRKRTTVKCTRQEAPLLYHRWVEKTKSQYGTAGTSMLGTFRKYLNEHCKPLKSGKQYHAEESFFENRLSVFFKKDVPLADFRQGHLEKYIAWRYDNHDGNGSKASPSTINKDINMISSFFSWCINNDLYGRVNPCSGARLREKNERHINLTADQIHELIVKSKDFSELHHAVMIVIYSGLRKSELASLRWTDIDFINRRINLRSETTKTKQHRSVPIPDVLYDFLWSLRKESDSEFVLTIGFAAITYRFQKFRNTLSFNPLPGVGDLKFHDLRHVYAQTLRNAGVDLGDIQAFLGHNSIRTTETRYAQSGGYDGVSKVNNINNIIQYQTG